MYEEGVTLAERGLPQGLGLSAATWDPDSIPVHCFGPGHLPHLT